MGGVGVGGCAGAGGARKGYGGAVAAAAWLEPSMVGAAARRRTVGHPNNKRRCLGVPLAPA